MKFPNLLGWFKRRKMDKVDLAVLRVSILIAALDGDVSKDELGEFSRLATDIPEYSPKDANQAFMDTLRAAGYLMLLSRVVGQDALLEAFIVEVERVFPAIAEFGPDRIKAAVSLWREMANADGEFSTIEREAIARIEQHFILRNQIQAQAVISGLGAGKSLVSPF